MHQQPKLELLISTMNRKDLSFLDAMFPHHKLRELHLLVINQTQLNTDLESDYTNIKVINSSDFGLSKSRNLGLKHATGEIILLADDDLEYLPDFEKIVLHAHKSHPAASLISFQFLNEAKQLAKSYPTKQGYLHSTKHYLTSFEMSFKRSHLIENDIKFDERFGIGAAFACAEEQVIRLDLIKCKKKIAYVAKPICLHKGLTSGANINKKANIEAMSAFKYLEYGKWTYLWLVKYVFFLFRKKYIPFSKIVNTYKVGTKAIKKIKES